MDSTTLRSTYPPDLYRGRTGEISARLRPNDTGAELEYADGGRCEYLATGDQTGGTFGLYRWTFGPDLSGPAPHFHRAITESFYVLSGEVELHDGTGWRDAQHPVHSRRPYGSLRREIDAPVTEIGRAFG